MRINNNIMAMNTHRQYAINNENMATATEKLSSGYRINSAADDAAGLAISEKMRAQIRGLDMASKNSEDAISLVQTAEGALEETESILQRMRELAVQSSSDTNETVDRTALEAEFNQLKAEIDDIAEDTSFNNMNLLDGTFGVSAAITAGSVIQEGAQGVTSVDVSGFAAGTHTITFSVAGVAGTPYTATLENGDDDIMLSVAQPPAGGGSITLDFGNGKVVSIEMASHAADAFDDDTLVFTVTGSGGQIQTGANEGQNLTISIGTMTATGLGVSGSSVATRSFAETAIDTLDTAINTVSGERAKLGAMQNRLEHKINNLDTSSENLSAAESRIRDIDMAAEMTEYTQTSILVQAATSMLAQANSAPQNVLTLLQ